MHGNSVALKNLQKRNFTIDFTSVSRSVNSASHTLIQRYWTTSVREQKRKKSKTKYLSFLRAERPFVLMSPRWATKWKKKIIFLTCGNTLSTGNRQVRLVRQSICILPWIPTQRVTSSTKAFNKNKAEVAALSVLQSVSIDKLSWVWHSWCYYGYDTQATGVAFCIDQFPPLSESFMRC